MPKKRNEPDSPLTLVNAQKKEKLPLPLLREKAAAFMKILSQTKKHYLSAETMVTFRFVDDKEICRWHRDYFQDPTPTDVIAFPIRDKVNLPLDPDLLGDVVISVETARRHSKQFGKSFEDEVVLYMIHGVLHMLGYDDLEPEKKKVMDQLQFSLLRKV